MQFIISETQHHRKGCIWSKHLWTTNFSNIFMVVYSSVWETEFRKSFFRDHDKNIYFQSQWVDSFVFVFNEIQILTYYSYSKSKNVTNLKSETWGFIIHTILRKCHSTQKSKIFSWPCSSKILKIKSTVYFYLCDTISLLIIFVTQNGMFVKKVTFLKVLWFFDSKFTAPIVKKEISMVYLHWKYFVW